MNGVIFNSNFKRDIMLKVIETQDYEKLEAINEDSP